eukprot:scaffold454151_cov23-Prasinocladus_malaysianus.AAC.1
MSTEHPMSDSDNLISMCNSACTILVGLFGSQGYVVRTSTSNPNKTAYEQYEYYKQTIIRANASTSARANRLQQQATVLLTMRNYLVPTTRTSTVHCPDDHE